MLRSSSKFEPETADIPTKDFQMMDGQVKPPFKPEQEEQTVLPTPSAPPLVSPAFSAPQDPLESLILNILQRKAALGAEKIDGFVEHIITNIKMHAETMQSPQMSHALQHAIGQYLQVLIQQCIEQKPINRNLQEMIQTLLILLQGAMKGMEDDFAIDQWSNLMNLYEKCEVVPTFAPFDFHNYMRASALRRLPEERLRFAVSQIVKVSNHLPSPDTTLDSREAIHLKFIGVCSRSLIDPSYNEFHLYMARQFIDSGLNGSNEYQHRIGLLLKNNFDRIDKTTLTPASRDEYLKLYEVITKLDALSEKTYLDDPTTFEDLALFINEVADIDELDRIVSGLMEKASTLLLTNGVHEALKNSVGQLIDQWMEKAALNQEFSFEVKLKLLIHKIFLTHGRMDHAFLVTQLAKIVPPYIYGTLYRKSFLAIFLINHVSAEELAKLSLGDLQQLVTTFTHSIETSLNGQKHSEKEYVLAAIPHARSFIVKMSGKLKGRQYDDLYVHLLTCFSTLLKVGDHHFKKELIKPLRTVLDSLPREAVTEELRQFLLDIHQAALVKTLTDIFIENIASFKQLVRTSYKMMGDENGMLKHFFTINGNELQVLRGLSGGIKNKNLLIVSLELFIYGKCIYLIRNWHSQIKFDAEIQTLIREFSDVVANDIGSVRSRIPFVVETATVIDITSVLDELKRFVGDGWNRNFFDRIDIIKKLFDEYEPMMTKDTSAQFKILYHQIQSYKKEYHLLNTLRMKSEVQLKMLVKKIAKPVEPPAQPLVVPHPVTSTTLTTKQKERVPEKIKGSKPRLDSEIASDSATSPTVSSLQEQPKLGGIPEQKTSYKPASQPLSKPIARPIVRAAKQRSSNATKPIAPPKPVFLASLSNPRKPKSESLLEGDEPLAMDLLFPNQEEIIETWAQISSKMLPDAIRALEKSKARQPVPSRQWVQTRKDPAVATLSDATTSKILLNTQLPTSSVIVSESIATPTHKTSFFASEGRDSPDTSPSAEAAEVHLQSKGSILEMPEKKRSTSAASYEKAMTDASWTKTLTTDNWALYQYRQTLIEDVKEQKGELQRTNVELQAAQQALKTTLDQLHAAQEKLEKMSEDAQKSNAAQGKGEASTALSNSTPRFFPVRSSSFPAEWPQRDQEECSYQQLSLSND